MPNRGAKLRCGFPDERVIQFGSTPDGHVRKHRVLHQVEDIFALPVRDDDLRGSGRQIEEHVACVAIIFVARGVVGPAAPSVRPVSNSRASDPARRPGSPG